MGSMKPEQDASTQAEIIAAMRDAWLQSVDDGAASAVRLDASTLAEEVISIVEGMGYAKEVAMDVGSAAEYALLMQFHIESGSSNAQDASIRETEEEE